MAYSYVNYTGNGTQKGYSIPFPFISAAYLSVTVGSSPKTLGTDYTVSGSTLTFTVAPSSGVAVGIRRFTPVNLTLVSYVDSSVLTQADLNLAQTQLLNVVQENSDLVNDTATAVNAALVTINTNTTIAQNSATSAAASAVAATNSAQLAAQSFSDVSTTSNTIGIGTLTFTISANKNFSAGQFLVISDNTAPTTNFMIGQISSYNSSTGALVVNITKTTGSGTKALWNVAISGANGISINWRGTYSGATTYAPNDAVTDGFSSYICINTSTGNALSNTSYWQPLALQGVKGDTGATGSTGATGVNWQGNWSSSQSYNVRDAVAYGGSSYYCILANTNQAPTNTTYWSVLALAGTNGANGTGTGNVVGGSASSVNELVLYNSTTGQSIGRSNTLSGLLKAAAGVVSAAVAGTDYQAPIGTISGLAKGNGANALTAATAGTDYQAPIGTISGLAKGNGANALTAATAGTDYQAPIGTISGLVKGNGANALTAAVANTDYLPVANPTATGSMTVPVVQTGQGTDIASAATVNLETATGNYVNITGTTAITAITLNQGHIRIVKFAAALTLTNSASLILPSGANITTTAGDTAVFVGEAASVVRCVSYQKASGAAVVASGGGGFNGIATFTSSGTWTIPTGITTAKVTVVGGGGGCGGFDNSICGTADAGPGAGGGTAIKTVTGLTPGGTVTVTVGAGGAVGSNGYPPGTGGTGGTSSFGAYCSATGGAGGNWTQYYDGDYETGGLGVSGNVNIRGAVGTGTRGGGTFISPAAYPLHSNQYGVGGSPWMNNSTTGRTTGFSGIVIIEY